MRHRDVDRSDLAPVDDERVVYAEARANQVHCQLEVREREDDAEVRRAAESRHEAWERDRLGVRVGVCGVGADVTELGLLHEPLSALLEHPHRDHLAVHEERHVVRHRVYPVLQHPGTLVRLAAVDVHDVHRLDLVEQVVGAEAGEDVREPRRVAHSDERRHPRLAGTLVEAELAHRRVEIVADVHVVDAGVDRCLEQRRAEAVERAHAVEHRVGAADDAGHALRRSRVDRLAHDPGPPCLRGERDRILLRRVGTLVGHDDPGVVVGRGEGAHGDAADTPTASEHDDLGHLCLRPVVLPWGRGPLRRSSLRRPPHRETLGQPIRRDGAVRTTIAILHHPAGLACSLGEPSPAYADPRRTRSSGPG